MLAEDLRKIAIRLIPDVGNVSDIIIESLTGGGNNRIFKLATPGGEYIVKQYFRHKEDRRNRLESEYLFTSFAWNHGIRCIAEPIAEDHDLSIGIYRFIEGGKYRLGDIGDAEISQALLFLTAVNQYKSYPDATGLPMASEACFSIEEHIRVVDLRIERLRGIEVGDDSDNEALVFVSKELAGVWSDIKAAIISKVAVSSMALAGKVSPDDTIISPSDFGFHNALVDGGGTIRFIDFEYAGWDDPAKTVCDFFCQVAVPVPMHYFEMFSGGIASCCGNTEKVLIRMKALLPLYKIKWCCIILNHFLPVGATRRTFADQDVMTGKTMQLEKAKSMLQSLEQIQFKGALN